MMVRLDKILHMITCFKVESQLLEQNQYSAPSQSLEVSRSSYLLFQRMGVIGVKNEKKSDEQNILDAIPFGREKFLLENLDKLAELRCTKNDPECALCILSDQCDYNNSKNDWMIN